MADTRKIFELEATVIDQMAAGEVVERPASVVKELLENALVAQATRVAVTLAEGGLGSILIADDGHGMAPDDVARCVLRHATSKLKTLADLGALQTLGFRGEGLSSIASVSRLTLTSRARGAAHGTRLVMAGGKVLAHKQVGAPEGTTVLVEDLFYNVPARRKFMRAPVTEQAHVVETLLRVGLGHRKSSIVLSGAKRRLVDVPRDPPVDACFKLALGAPAGPVVLLDHEAHGIEVRGALSEEAVGRSGGGRLWLFVNGRFIRDRALRRAALAACAEADGPMPPAGLLYLTLPAAEVDVNVHPQKLEARFVDAHAVHEAVTEAVRAGAGAWQRAQAARPGQGSMAHAAFGQKAFRGATAPAWRGPVPGVRAALGASGAGPRAGGWVPAPPGALGPGGRPSAAESAAAANVRGGPASGPARASAAPVASGPIGAGPNGGSLAAAEGGPGPALEAARGDAAPHLPGLAPESPAKESLWRALTPLAVAPEGHLCCKAGPDLVLVDLSAAKRALLEAALAHSGFGPEALLMPPTWSPRDREAARVDDYLIETAERPSPWGVVLEAVGPGQYVIMALPKVMAAMPPQAVAAGLLEALEAVGLGCHAAHVEARAAVQAAWLECLVAAWQGPGSGSVAVWGPSWLAELEAMGVRPSGALCARITGREVRHLPGPAVR